MNKEKRKEIRLRFQAHPDTAALRTHLLYCSYALSALDVRHDEKVATLIRRLQGLKMPKRVVLLHKGFFAVRPCVSGVIFTAAVFASPGTRDIQKIAAPMARLSDALAYYFRNSRMRGKLEYNLDESQAKADAQYLNSCEGVLDKLADLLQKCGVLVIGATGASIDFATLPTPAPDVSDLFARIKRLEGMCDSLMGISDKIKDRLAAVESKANQIHILNPTYPPPVADAIGNEQPDPKGPINAPTVWCNTKL